VLVEQLGKVAHSIEIGDIKGASEEDSPTLCTNGSAGMLERAIVDVGDGHAGAPTAGPQGQLPADAAARAGDHHDLVYDVCHRAPVLTIPVSVGLCTHSDSAYTPPTREPC